MPRSAAVAVGVLVVLGGLYALLTLVSSRDDAGVKGAAVLGVLEPDRGAAHRPAAGRAGAEPPTSGPHAPELVTRDARTLSHDALLHALELGDVVLAYPDRTPPTALRALQARVSGPFDAELAAAGQAVVLARVPGIGQIEALAWRRRLRAAGAGDPGLRAFAERWLGQGLRASR